MKYILEGHNPVRCDDVLKWGRFFDDSEGRRVARTELPGDVMVSTVFLGLDHNYGSGPPILFETMIFGGPHDEFLQQYATWEEAEAGHLRAVEIAKRG